MAPGFPEKLEPFSKEKVPSEGRLRHAKVMKLLMLGLTAALPVVGLLLSVPYLQLMEGNELYFFTFAIPFTILLVCAAIFAYSNKLYGTDLQYFAAWKALSPVLKALEEEPSAILVSPTTPSEAYAAGIKVKEFVLRFANAPSVNIYYYDSAVHAGLGGLVTSSPGFKGLRLRAHANLKEGKKGRFERYGAVYLPHWGFTEETRDLEWMKKRVSISGMTLVKEDPEPSRIEFLGKEVVVVLSLKPGAHKQVWKAAQAAVEIMNALEEEGVISPIPSRA